MDARAWQRDPVEVPTDGRWRRFEPGPLRIEFREDPDGSLSLESVVGQAIAAGATCWSDVSAAGEFDGRRAVLVVDALVGEIRRRAMADPAWLSEGA